MKSWHSFLTALLLSVPLAAQVPDPPSVWWKASGTADSMNFNPVCRLSGDTALLFPVANAGKECDVLTVYGSADSTGEEGLWQLRDSMGRRIGLTTRRILTECGDIRFGGPDAGGGIINYLSQSWQDAPSGDTLQLAAGLADILPFGGMMGEFLYFGHRLADSTVTQWMSYLAIKYGITLYGTNYLNSMRQCIWNHDEAAAESAFIAGVGRDDAFGLCQSGTYFCDGRMLLELSGGTALQDNSFIVFGKDSTPVGERVGRFLCNDTLWDAYCRTRVQVTGASARECETSVTLEDTLWSGDGIATRLAVLRGGTDGGGMPEMHSAAMRDTLGRLRFEGLRWDTDGSGSDVFFFARESADQIPASILSATDGSPLSNPDGVLSEGVPGAGKRPEADGEVPSPYAFPEYDLSPNPNHGTFTLSMEYPQESTAIIRLYTPDGKMLRQRECSGGKSYRITESIENQGIYILDIESVYGRKLIKMVVN